jgi:hypothetical protein
MAAEDEWNDERHVWMVRASNGAAVGPVSVAQIAQAMSFGKLRDVDDVRHVQAASWEKVGPFMTRMRPPTQAQVDATGQIAIDSSPTSPPRARGEIATSPGIVVRRWTLGGLFDFTFTTFFTTRIVGVLYVAVLLLAVGYLLACETFGVTTIVGAIRASQELGDTSAIPFVIGAALMLAGLVGAVAIVICGRVALEFIVVTFRISETLTEIKARTK